MVDGVAEGQAYCRMVRIQNHRMNDKVTVIVATVYIYIIYINVKSHTRTHTQNKNIIDNRPICISAALRGLDSREHRMMQKVAWSPYMMV